MAAFDFPELIAVEPRKDLINGSRHVRYCYLKTQKLQSMPSKACKCGNTSFYRFGTRTTSYRDLPRLQDRIVLVIKKQRYICRKLRCGKTFIQEIPGLDSRRFMTTRCLEWIRENCFRFTFQHIADHIGCDLRTVRDIAYERMDELDKVYRPYLPVWLGIDETYFKGHINECCSVFVDLHRKRPVDLIHGHGKEEVSEWLRRFGDRSHVEGVAMDMAGHFRDVVQDLLPHAQIVADRFHIEKRANKALAMVRDRIERRLKKELADKWDADKWDPDKWKTYSRLLLKHMHQISDENDRAKEGKSPGLKKRVRARRQPSRSEFVKWLELQPDVKIAYELKESLCDIYRCKRRFTAQNALKKWEASIRTLEEQEPQIDDSILNPFRDLLQTITKWKTEFLAFFPEGKSNGYTEAFNSVLKRMNRSGNNYTFDVLRARVLFGRKPQHETVKLKPPSLESFLRDSQPQSEICLLCGQSFTSDEFAFTANDPMPGQSVVMHNNDLEAPKCPLCQKRINSRMLENLVLSRPAEEKFSKEYFEDTEVGDVKSAARFSRTICDSCGKTSDTDRLHPWRLMFLGGNYLYICDACLEEIHGRGENEGTCNEMTAQPCTNGEPDKASLIDDLKGLMVSAPPLQPVTSCPSPGIDQHHHHNDEVSVPVIRKLPRRRILAKELGCASPSRVRPKQLLLFPER